MLVMMQLLKLAKEVYAKIQGGLSFAQAASQFSEDLVQKQKVV